MLNNIIKTDYFDFLDNHDLEEQITYLPSILVYTKNRPNHNINSQNIRNRSCLPNKAIYDQGYLQALKDYNINV